MAARLSSFRWPTVEITAYRFSEVLSMDVKVIRFSAVPLAPSFKLSSIS